MAGKTITSLALLLAACATPAAMAGGERSPEQRDRSREEREARRAPQYYGCLLERTVAGARFTMRGTVQLDGRVSNYIFIWWGNGRTPRIDIHLVWIGETYGPMTEGTSIRMVLAMRRQDQARLELRRIVDGAPAGEALAAGPSTHSSIHMLDVAWNRIDAAARAPGGVAVQLVRWDGRIMFESRIDAAAFDGAVAEVAAARDEMAAMVADYRNRCRPERDQEVVVYSLVAAFIARTKAARAAGPRWPHPSVHASISALDPGAAMAEPTQTIVDTRGAQMFPTLACAEIARLKRFGEPRPFRAGTGRPPRLLRRTGAGTGRRPGG